MADPVASTSGAVPLPVLARLDGQMVGADPKAGSEEFRRWLESYRFGGWQGDSQHASASPDLPGSPARRRGVGALDLPPLAREALGLTFPAPPSPTSPSKDLPDGYDPFPPPPASGLARRRSRTYSDQRRRESIPEDMPPDVPPMTTLDGDDPIARPSTPRRLSVNSIPLSIKPPSDLPRTASEVIAHYQKARYLPAPVPPEESLSLRLSAIARLNLLSPSRRSAVRRIVKIAKRFFNDASETLFVSIVDGSKQIILSEEGNLLEGLGVRLTGHAGTEPDDPGPRVIDLNTGFCPHALTNAIEVDTKTGRQKKGESTFVVRNAAADWRFEGNVSPCILCPGACPASPMLSDDVLLAAGDKEWRTDLHVCEQRHLRRNPRLDVAQVVTQFP